MFLPIANVSSAQATDTLSFTELRFSFDPGKCRILSRGPQGGTKRSMGVQSSFFRWASQAFHPLATQLDSSSVARRRVARELEKQGKPGMEDGQKGCIDSRRTVNNRRFSERRYSTGGRRTAFFKVFKFSGFQVFRFSGFQVLKYRRSPYRLMPCPE